MHSLKVVDGASVQALWSANTFRKPPGASSGSDHEREEPVADKALLLGVNNYKSVNHLSGCIDDVKDMGKLLTEIHGFEPANVKTLTDGQVVKDSIKKQMKWLFRDAGN